MSDLGGGICLGLWQLALFWVVQLQGMKWVSARNFYACFFAIFCVVFLILCFFSAKIATPSSSPCTYIINLWCSIFDIFFPSRAVMCVTQFLNDPLLALFCSCSAQLESTIADLNKSLDTARAANAKTMATLEETKAKVRFMLLDLFVCIILSYSGMHGRVCDQDLGRTWYARLSIQDIQKHVVHESDCIPLIFVWGLKGVADRDPMWICWYPFSIIPK